MASPHPEGYLPDNWLLAGRALRGVTHGVNNHLGAILAYAELIALSPTASADIASMARGISAAVRESTAQLDTVAALVSEDLAAVETIHLNAALPHISNLFRFEIERAGLGLDLVLPDQVCAFPGVRTRIYRALSHVVRHAADAMNPQRNASKLRVRLTRTVGGFAIEVEGNSGSAEIPASLDEARAHIAYHHGRMTCPKPGTLRIEIPQDTGLIKAGAAGAS